MKLEEGRVNRLLLIDRDEERAGRLVRRLRLRGFACEVTDSFLYALTKLEWQRPAAILVREELRIDGMTAAEFCAVVKQDSTLGDIVLARAAAPKAPRTTSFSRFDLELDDSDPDALATLLVDRITGDDGDADSGDEDSTVVVSDNDESPYRGFLSMLELLSINLSSGRISLLGDHRVEPIFVVLDHGQIVHAEYGGLEGVPAFRRLVDALVRGGGIRYVFELVPRWKLSTFPRTIKLADRERLLEARPADPELGTQDLSVPIGRTDS